MVFQYKIPMSCLGLLPVHSFLLAEDSMQMVLTAFPDYPSQHYSSLHVPAAQLTFLLQQLLNSLLILIIRNSPLIKITSDLFLNNTSSSSLN